MILYILMPLMTWYTRWRHLQYIYLYSSLSYDSSPCCLSVHIKLCSYWSRTVCILSSQASIHWLRVNLRSTDRRPDPPAIASKPPALRHSIRSFLQKLRMSKYWVRVRIVAVLFHFWSSALWDSVDSLGVFNWYLFLFSLGVCGIDFQSSVRFGMECQ